MSALNLGFSYSDLRHMPYHRLMWAMNEWRRMNAGGQEQHGGVRMATQADIDFLK